MRPEARERGAERWRRPRLDGVEATGAHTTSMRLEEHLRDVAKMMGTRV